MIYQIGFDPFVDPLLFNAYISVALTITSTADVSIFYSIIVVTQILAMMLATNLPFYSFLSAASTLTSLSVTFILS